MERLSRAITVDEIARVIVECGGDAMGADGNAVIVVWEGDERQHLTMLASRFPAEKPAVWASYPRSRNLATVHTASTGEPQWFETRTAYLGAYPEGGGILELRDIEGMAVLPLGSRERSIGAIAFTWRAPHPFTDDERAYATTLGRIFSQALERGRLIEEQRTAKERAESNERRSRLLSEASALLTMSLVDEEIFRRAAEIAVPAFADWCIFDLAQPTGEVRRALVHHKDRALIDVTERVRQLPPRLGEGSWVSRALEAGESQLVTSVDLQELGRRAGAEKMALADQLGTRSFIVVPFVVRGRIEGAFTFLRGAQAAPYIMDDVALAEDLTHRAGLAIENSRLFHTERRHAKDVQRLQRISEALTVALTPDDVAAVVVTQGASAIGAFSGTLTVYDDKHGTVTLTGAPGPNDDETSRAIVSGDDSPLGEAIARGEPVFVESAAERVARYRSAEDCPYGPPGARVALPLRAGDKLLGALAFIFDGSRSFSDEDKDFLVAAARQCSLALERARLYAEEAKAREQTLVLLRVTSALAQAKTTEEVGAAVVEDVLDVLGADVGFLGLRGHEGEPTRVLFKESAPEPLRERWKTLDLRENLPANDVLRTGEALFFEDSNSYREAYPRVESVLTPPLQAAALLPITVGGRVTGFIGLRYATPKRFDDDTVRLLQTVAIQCSDALERAELLEREGKARRGAEVANRAKDEFLAMLGHELRNPLMPIVTALSLMRIKGDEHFVKERAMIERQAQHLLRLVDDLLDVSRIARGKIDLRRKRADIGSIARQAMETTSPLFEQRRHQFEAHLEDDLLVDGDESRLVQVVANLLTNAAKYTEPGGTIALRAEQDGDDIVLSVKDSGVGIDPALLPRVFDLFVQGARGIDRALGGLGLGLSLVKSITVLHGGTVSAHSGGPGTGAEFVVRLPRASKRDGSMEAPPTQDEAMETPASAPLRILVVDDNVDAADSLAETLEELGHKTAVAYDGPEGLTRARALSPEVALLDIGLPVMDGYELARTLKKEHGEHVTLVAVTGYGQPADRARAKAAGFHHHFVKPIHLAALLALLQRVGADQTSV